MFLTSDNEQKLFENFKIIGIKNEIKNKAVLIKINLSGVYRKNNPRTDIALIKILINYIYQNGGKCAITEGANGNLTKNIIASSLEDFVKHYGIKIIDADLEAYDEVFSYGEPHYIPRCFQEYPVRIAVPSASKREGLIYSNNIKLFVGAVPRKMCKLDDDNVPEGVPRPKIHKNLFLSVANLFLAIQNYSPFQFYINGGLAYNENKGEFFLNETFVGNDALELDCHLFQTFFSDCEHPDYLDILTTRRFNNNV
jgi:hypothetical protein